LKLGLKNSYNFSANDVPNVDWLVLVRKQKMAVEDNHAPF
jgi:hypothetical protein